MNSVLPQKYIINTSRSRILCFLHLPRTGGTTINRMLKYTFGDRAVFHADLLAEYGGEYGLAAALPGDPGIYRYASLISGHYGVAHPLILNAPRPVGIMAVMRHPLERIVSLYDYIRGTPNHPEHAELAKRSLNQALDSVPGFAVHCRNAQLLTLFNATDTKGIQEALSRHPYLLGRMDSLEAFAQSVLSLFRCCLGGPLPHFNKKPFILGLAPAKAQSDYGAALTRLERCNRAEIEFFSRLPPIWAHKPRKDEGICAEPAAAIASFSTAPAG